MQVQELLQRVAGLNECSIADLQGLDSVYPNSIWVYSEASARLAAAALTALGYSGKWSLVEPQYSTTPVWRIVAAADEWLVTAVAASAEKCANERN